MEDSYHFHGGKGMIYLGMLLSEEEDNREEIRRGICDRTKETRVTEKFD